MRHLILTVAAALTLAAPAAARTTPRAVHVLRSLHAGAFVCPETPGGRTVVSFGVCVLYRGESVLPVGGGQPVCTSLQRGAVYGPAWQTAWNATSGGYQSYGYGYSYCTGSRWVWE